VVVVEDSDDKSEQNISKSDEEEKASDNSSSDKTNHFDGCPDEIVFKIFDFLDEKEVLLIYIILYRLIFHVALMSALDGQVGAGLSSVL